MNPLRQIPLLGILVAIILIFALAITAAIAMSDATYDLSWWTVNAGGGTTASGKYSLSGTAGQYDAGVLSGGKYDLGGGYWATGGEKYAFVPILFSAYCNGFRGPREWEGNTRATSPSNNSGVDANGPLCFSRKYIGNPDDDYPDLESDYFYFYSSSGQFTVSVTEFLKSDAQVLLLYELSGTTAVLFKADQESGNYILPYSGPPGKYLIRVFAVANHPKGNGDYNLTVTK